MTSSNESFSNATWHPAAPYPLFYDTTTGSIQHFNGSVNTQIGGFSPNASGTVNLTSGTAVQNATSVFATYHIFIGGSTSGTVQVAIGNTSACSNVIVPSSTANAANNHVLTIRVPAQWWLKVTTTNGATIATGTTILTEGSF
jgi:hypothetical protein